MRAVIIIVTTHQPVSQAGLPRRPGPREEPPRRPGHQAGPLRRHGLAAVLLRQPGRQRASQKEPLRLRGHQHRHQHRPDLLQPLPDQTILLHQHPDRWDHLLTEAVRREAEDTAAAELPEVAVAVAGDADKLYYC